MSIKRTLLVVLATSLALVGSSSDKDNFRTNSFPAEVTAGQQDISNALIRSAEILVTGLPDENNEGMLNYQSFYTQASGTATVVLPLNPGSKMRLFELVTLPANADINQAASVSRCQWVEGCGSKEFGADISPVYQWQSVVWDLRKDERVVVTPLTHLAAALAFEFAYAETPEGENNTQIEQPKWQATGYYSPYSVEQAVSQVSRLFGISNVQTTFPADLTRINSLNSKDPISAKNSIRYGAILAAWAHLQETNAEFTENATNEFLDNNAQIMQKDAAGRQVSVLTLKTIYSLAKENLENLEKLPVNNAGIKSLITDVVNEFDSDLTKLNADLTDTSPASIKDLFGDTAFNDYKLGVERTKLFVEDLVDGATKLIDSEYFFGKEYDTALRGYIDQQKQFFKTNKDNFNEVLKSLKSAESIYIDSYYGSDCSSSLGATLWSDCNYSGNVLTLTDKSGKQVTLSMKNVTSNKQAVDIEMTGELQINDLLFKLNDSATNKSRVRLFYSEETSQVLASTIEPIGYEYNWASFSFNDTVKKDQEWTGNFSLLYRGVNHPTDSNADMHFNIDTLRLSSRISDHIGGTDRDDKEASSVFIAAQSSTADTYYNPNPDEKFGKINGFFTEQSANTGQDKPGLVSYKLGEELIHNQTVKYFDFYINDKSAQSFRYRFYPDVVRNQNAAGQVTVGNNDAITTHKMAVCPLSKKKDGEWGVDGACSPAQVFNGKRDVQKSINTFWKAGAFSYIDLPGKGEYFAKWPATEKNGCFELDKLSGAAEPVTITESAKFVSAAVLGLDTLRVTTEVMLEKQPRTLLDVLISAPKEDRYNVTAALSHNYSNLTEDKIFVGTGNNLDRLIFNYNTDSSFKRMGSLSVYKSGVTLAESKVDAELMVGLNQSYSNLPHKYVTASNGGQQICVTENAPFNGPKINSTLEKDAALSLTFRGVTYGSIRNEKGVWIARFIDGTWIPLVP